MWMNDLVAEKHQRYWNIGIGVFIIFIFSFVLYRQSTIEKDRYSDILNTSYSGKIKSKNFYKEGNHIRLMNVLLQNDSLIMVCESCYQNIEINDSIVKNRGSFDFTIYKPLDTIVVDIKTNSISSKR